MVNSHSNMCENTGTTADWQQAAVMCKEAKQNSKKGKDEEDC